MLQYVSILMVFVGCAAVAGLLVWLPTMLGPRRLSPVKLESFECGKVPIALPEGRFAIKFSTTAIFFIIFDVEMMFVFPWTVIYRDFIAEGLGLLGFVSMVVYLAILMLGLLYIWRKGGLAWD